MARHVCTVVLSGGRCLDGLCFAWYPFEHILGIEPFPGVTSQLGPMAPPFAREKALLEYLFTLGFRGLRGGP